MNELWKAVTVVLIFVIMIPFLWIFVYNYDPISSVEQTEKQKIEAAFDQGCNRLRTLENCTAQETNKVITYYLPAGQREVTTLFDICELKDPKINTPELCARACGCPI